MKTYLFPLMAALMLVGTSCKKTVNSIKEKLGTKATTGVFVDHLIAAGQQTSNHSAYQVVNSAETRFVAVFDSSAIYQSATEENQQDINKLYGFSDNNQDHHTNSARIGWRWYQNQLQLFAYVYNNAVQSAAFITTVAISQENTCSISVQGSQYVFTVNGVQVTMPRASTTETAAGYRLYPYFGGDEMAPHDIHIRIKDL